MNAMQLGVIGSGTMGYGIAQCAAQFGWKAVLYDIADTQLDKAVKAITGSLAKRVEKGKMSQERMDEVLGHITTTTNLQDLADSAVVVEAVVEKLEIKGKVLSEMEALLDEGALLATNTSSLAIVEIANYLKDPSRLVGIHFFNPAPAMKLVEIVKTVVARDDVVQRAQEFAQGLGKETIVSKDTPGFIVNYLQYPFRLNAIRMVQDGVATPEDIDKAAKLALNHPMGPLELQDLVGLDVTYNAVSAIYEETKDPAMAPPLLLKRMVSAGLLGRKAGKGFYDYTKKDQK